MENKEFQKFLKKYKEKIGFFAVDEAHTIESWSDFRESLHRIGETRKLVPKAKWVGLFQYLFLNISLYVF